MKMCIYTFGYTLFKNDNSIDIERMFQILKCFRVDFLVDVRSIPYSKLYSQCDANNLKIQLRNKGIKYIHMPELGAKADNSQEVFSKASDIFFDSIFPIPKSNRPENIELQAEDEIVDFGKFRNSDYFLSGLKRIKTAYDKGYTLALMCSEKRPVDCHRFFFIAKAIDHMFGEFIEVKHIILNDKNEICTISNKDINAQLKDIVLKKNEIKGLDILNTTVFAPAKIDNYYGVTIQDKLLDFCDRYWNLMHGWKRTNNIFDNKSQDYD